MHHTPTCMQIECSCTLPTDFNSQGITIAATATSSTLHELHQLCCYALQATAELWGPAAPSAATCCLIFLSVICAAAVLLHVA
jgi:hypothetical protein